MSTVVVKAWASVPSDANASRMALAECSADCRVLARAKTLDPDPLIANPVAPASKAALFTWR